MRALLSLAVAAAVLPGPAGASLHTTPDPLDRTLASAFRVDLTGLRVALDYRPRADRVRGVAVLRFRMRPGQSRPLFHFNPLRAVGPRAELAMIRSISLDGARLDPGNRSDVRMVRPAPGAETAFEVRRRLRDDDGHALRITWATPAPRAPSGWLYPTFDDTEGPDDETETLWPTVSSPDELVRHRIRVRVHAPQRYTVAGSGAVRRVGGAPVPTWVVDTGRAVSSSTVFFAAVPGAEVRSTGFRVAGVRVRIVSDRAPAVVRRARVRTAATLREAVAALGPFPMPRLSVLLTGWGSGMEYYGATRTGPGSVRHELWHMYFGTSAVNRTWRDTWIDEAVVVWLEAGGRVRSVPAGFASSLGRGRPVAAPGFDEAAYGAGARVVERLARALGGDAEMRDFLAGVHRRRAFAPFTTRQLIDDLVAAQDVLGRADLRRLMLSPPS